MRVLIVSCSLNPDSRSARLAEHAAVWLREQAPDVSLEWLDLRTLDLPLCDGASAYAHPAVSDLAGRVADADAVLLAVPIYNFDANAAAKNLVELTGAAWTGKLVGFLCAAGGQGSYMSVMALANSLMLDFRCLVLPRFVYTVGPAQDPDPLTPEVEQRIGELTAELVRVGTALAAAPAQ